jgi:hypothetical protein
MELREIRREDVDCICLVQERDQCWDLVHTVMNVWFHKRQAIS